MRNSTTTSLTFYFFASYLTASILLEKSFADTTHAGIFTTKSGRKIPLSLIRRYIHLGEAYESDLEYMIFEYNPASNSLFSFHHSIDLPTKSNRSRITLSSDVKRYTGDFEGTSFRHSSYRFPNIPNVYMSNSENGDSFFFDADKDYSLVAAFGDSLDLHPINDRHNVFINHYKLSSRDTNTTPSPKPKRCTRTYEYSLYVISDGFMDTRFGNRKTVTFYMIEQFISQSLKMLKDSICIDIRLVGIVSFRSLNEHLYFQQNICRTANTNGAQCQTILSNHIMKKVMTYPLDHVDGREVVLFISGLNTSGNLAGLALKSRACDVKKSKIWIKGLSRVALYHELGHLFGANHVRDGIMKPSFVIGNSVAFSKRSYNEIEHFVEKDSRSWCLRRQYSYKHADTPNDKWTQKKFSIPTLEGRSTYDTTVVINSISLASLSSGRDSDLLLLVSKGNFWATHDSREINLIYGFVKDIWNNNGFSGVEETKYKPLGLTFSADYMSFNLRFFKSAQPGSKNVILSYLYNGDSAPKGTRYKVGSVKANGDIDVGSWSDEKLLGNAQNGLPYSRGFSDLLQETPINMNIGSIRNQRSVDLLYMQLETETVPPLYTNTFSNPFKALKTTLKYKIGFDMSTTGIIQGGWSDYFAIPGGFDLARSIGGSIMDIDGNGKPDLVIFVEEADGFFYEGNYTYFRIGKDLSSDGIVTGGWTDHKMIRNQRGRRLESIWLHMDVGRDLKSGHPVLIVAKTERAGKGKLRFTHKNLLRKEMKTVKKYSAIESVSESGEIWYNNNPTVVEKCRRDLNVCKSQIDRLQIFQGLPDQLNLFSNRRMKKEYGSFINVSSAGGSKNNSVEYFPDASNQDALNNRSRSVYCTGFQYFLEHEDVCNTIDAKSVYSKGLELTFTNYLNDRVLGKDISSKSLFEDTLGISGNGNQIIVQAEIRGWKKPTRRKIKYALRRVRALPQFPSLKDLGRFTWQNLIKTKLSRKKQNVWKVNFYFIAKDDGIFS